MSENLEKVEEMAEFFNKRAEGYNEHMVETVDDFSIYYDKLSLPLGKSNESMRVLDLGCGTGLELEALFKRRPNAEVTCVDMSQEMLNILRKTYEDKLDKINIIKGSYFQLNFKKGYYDYVISSMTMHHFLKNEKVELYKRINNALKEDGKYIEGDYMVSLECEKELLKRYYELMNGVSHKEKCLYHIDIPFSLETQKELFKEANFNNIELIHSREEQKIVVLYKNYDKEKYLKSILKAWGLNDEAIVERENIKYNTDREEHIWTVNNNFILKMTKSEIDMKNNILLPNLLSKENIPLQKIIKTISGSDYIQQDNKFYVLVSKIQGEPLQDYFQGEYLKTGEQLGKHVANLHLALKNITNELKTKKALYDSNSYEQILGWVNKELNKHRLKSNLAKEELQAFDNLREDYIINFKELYSKLPRQVIHRDIHRENMIFQGEKLTGYIDFDLSQINARIFDLCYLLTGALSEVFEDLEKRKKWIDFSKRVIEGYECVTPLNEDEKASIKYMFYTIEFIMVAYFYREGYLNIADTNVKMTNWIKEVW